MRYIVVVFVNGISSSKYFWNRGKRHYYTGLFRPDPAGFASEEIRLAEDKVIRFIKACKQVHAPRRLCKT